MVLQYIGNFTSSTTVNWWTGRILVYSVWGSSRRLSTRTCDTVRWAVHVYGSAVNCACFWIGWIVRFCVSPRLRCLTCTDSVQVYSVKNPVDFVPRFLVNESECHGAAWCPRISSQHFVHSIFVVSLDEHKYKVRHNRLQYSKYLHWSHCAINTRTRMRTGGMVYEYYNCTGCMRHLETGVGDGLHT